MELPLAFIIEDDQNLSLTYAEAAKEAGYQPKIIGDGREALVVLTSALPELVILDLNLPKVSGVEILNYIRSDRRLKQTRVIVTSGDNHIAETLHDSADIVLLKPVAYDQLRDLAIRLRNKQPE